jgi:molybdopterin converting factor small subunit
MAEAAHGSARQIKVLYFAGLRETRGDPEEVVSTAAGTPAALYRELAARHGFPAVPEGMKVAVNDEIADWQTALASGDTVVFLTPFGGGR